MSENVGKMGFIDKEDFYRSLRLAAADGGNNCCHPGFFFSVLGALRGTVLAKRLSLQRHFIVLTKSACVESRFLDRQRPREVILYTSVTHCVRNACS